MYKMPPFPSVFHCTLLNREVDRDDCHRCRLGEVCAGIPSRLMRINRQAPVGPTSGPQYPPTFRESARVGVSGQREKGDAGTGPGTPFSPPKAIFTGRVRARSEILPPSSAPPAPRARRGEG